MGAPRFIRNGGVQIEYEWLGPRGPAQDVPPIVFLHEGLGSISLWRDFPQALVDLVGATGLVYSRQGYGRSDPLQAPRTPRYMHTEALERLPQLLDELRVQSPLLLGHSDGASIALIHAGGARRPVSGVIAMAPHVMVEQVSIDSITAARQAYLDTDLRARLGRHHADPDAAFWGWNDIWLHADFRAWNIEEYLPNIAAPVLAIQGLDDEYGTLEQIRSIARRARRVQLLELPDCGHSPQRDQNAAVLAAAASFIRSLPGSNSRASTSLSGAGRPSSNP